MNKMYLKIMCCLLKKEENELYQIFEGEWKIVVKCWCLKDKPCFFLIKIMHALKHLWMCYISKEMMCVLLLSPAKLSIYSRL